MKTSSEEKLQAVLDAISEQDVVLSTAMKKKAELRTYLKDICEHPRRIRKDYYSEGSYYDKEEWTTREYCAYCSHDFGVIKRSTGGYG